MITAMVDYKGKIKYGTYLYPPVLRELERLIDLYGLKYAVVNAAIYSFSLLPEDQQMAAIRKAKEFEAGAVGVPRDAAALGHQLRKQAADLARPKNRSKKRSGGKR